jgi:hypothetical protein
VVCIDRWPAVVISAIGEAPVGARFVNADASFGIERKFGQWKGLARSGRGIEGETPPKTRPTRKQKP